VPQRREGELFWSIAHGIPATTMPGFAAHLSEVEIWSLVQFLDAQVAAVNALALADGLKPLLPVPAPDFTYEFTGRQQESLRQQREDHVALLVFYTLPSSLPRLRELAMLENAYTAAGAVVIAMPMPASSAATNLARPNGGESILAFTSPWVAATYRMFAQQSSGQTGEPAGRVPAHVEYLIDRFGYIRVRWLGAPESPAGQSDALQRQIDILAHEPPRRQILWGHRH
jgi:putative copper resistance protein D